MFFEERKLLGRLFATTEDIDPHNGDIPSVTLHAEHTIITSWPPSCRVHNNINIVVERWY